MHTYVYMYIHVFPVQTEHVARYSSVFSLWLGVQSLFHRVTRPLSLISLPSLDVCMPRNKFGLEQRSCPVRMKHLQQHTCNNNALQRTETKQVFMNKLNLNMNKQHQSQNQKEQMNVLYLKSHQLACLDQPFTATDTEYQ